MNIRIDKKFMSVLKNLRKEVSKKLRISEDQIASTCIGDDGIVFETFVDDTYAHLTFVNPRVMSHNDVVYELENFMDNEDVEWSSN